MRNRTALLLVLGLLVAGLVPALAPTAAAHESCVTDEADDAPAGYDIGEFCVSGGDEDPVEFGAITAAAADDLVVVWDAGDWTVTYTAGATTVAVLGEPVDCAATTTVTDDVQFDALVPASCLPGGNRDVVAQTFDGAGTMQDETSVAVGGPGDDHAAHGGESPAGLVRLEGANRIETAVAISADAYPTGAPAVLLANADNPVDALPASRSAYEGPILYVPACGELPTVVADEIARLSPETVVALGGVNAVCDEIAEAALAAAGIAPAPDRVQGTPNPDAVPADQQEGDVRAASFALLDTRPEVGYEDAAGDAFIARNEAGVTVTVRVTGLIPNTLYNSHMHEGSCADGGGEHFKFDPAGGDTPPNEIHLPFMTDDTGAATQTSTHTEVPGEDGRSIVMHPRDNGPARVMCAEWAAAE